MIDNLVKSYDGQGATALWLPLAIHGKLNPNRWGVCIDCGIDEGQYSKHYATIFDNVISIDASIRPQAREYLKDCTNVQLIEKCLWNKVGDTVTWHELKYHTFLSSANKEYIITECEQWNIPKNTISTYDVITDTLDNIIDQSVDFLKIDCEASDMEIIEGAEQIIAKYRPTVQVESPTFVNASEDSDDTVESILSRYNYKRYQHTEYNFTDNIYLPM